MGFAETGWGFDMLQATAVTLVVALAGFGLGTVFGMLSAAASLSPVSTLRHLADGYTTTLRGIPDLLVIYLFYFGGSTVITQLGHLFGAEGFVSAPVFLTGALAIGVVSGAYQAELFRGAVLALSRGEIEAAKAYGMEPFLHFRLCRRSRVRASHLIGAPSLPGSGLWKTGLVRRAGSATQVHRGKKGRSRTQTSAFDATCPAPQISRPCPNATFSSSHATSTINRVNASDT